MVEQGKNCEYGNCENQACCDRFIAGLVDETLYEKCNTNGHRDKDGNIVIKRSTAGKLDRQSTPVKVKQHSL